MREGAPPARIGIVMASAVGNAVHTLPLLNSLKAHWPGVRTTWVMQPGPAGLVRGHPAVDDVLLLDRRRGWRGFAELRRELAGRPFDLLVTLQAYFKSAVVSALARAPVKLGYDRARARELTWLSSTHRLPARPRGHVQDEYLEFLEHLGVPVRMEWGLGSTAEERARYAGLLPPSDRPWVALVLGTTRPEKEWPARRYAELADRVAGELGASTLLVGGRSAREEAAAAIVRERAARPPLDLREWDLRRVVYLLERADALVTPDTGPLHVGVALGTATVAMMGYTNPKRFGPYRRFGDLMVDAYGDPGEDYPAEAGHRPGRMERITVDRVLEKVEQALRRYPRSSRAGHPAP